MSTGPQSCTENLKHFKSHVGNFDCSVLANFYVAAVLYKSERLEENAFIPGVLLRDRSELAGWYCRLSPVNSEGHEVNTRFLPHQEIKLHAFIWILSVNPDYFIAMIMDPVSQSSHVTCVAVKECQHRESGGRAGQVGLENKFV